MRCAAKTKAGTYCQNEALEGDDFCWWHSSNTATERQAAQAKGGRKRHQRALLGDADPVRIECIDDLLAILSQELADLLMLERSINRARAVTYLVKTAGELLVTGELEQRLQRLEDAYGKKP